MKPIISADNKLGIFDSGLGGLTVLNAIHKMAPNQSIDYFADTANFPYGEKTRAEIQTFANNICDFLIAKKCQTILIACNSASAAAYESVVKHVGGSVEIFNVIDPVINYLQENFAAKKIGIIATTQTINSNVYQQKIASSCPSIKLATLATPKLAPMIEENMQTGNFSQEIIAEYLQHESLKDIEALVLGCTHYPLIKSEIENFYKNKVTVIDASEIVAKELVKHLSPSERSAEIKCYVSGKIKVVKKSIEKIIQNPIQVVSL